jgi:hypothetical protein
MVMSVAATARSDDGGGGSAVIMIMFALHHESIESEHDGVLSLIWWLGTVVNCTPPYPQG